MGKTILQGVALWAMLAMPVLDDRPLTLLEVGQQVHRHLSAGESDTYRLPLSADQYVELSIDQQGVELSVLVAGPGSDGSDLLETRDPTGPRESRVVTFVAPAAGEYRIRIAPAARHTTGGEYLLTLAAPRAPSALERRLEEARILSGRAAALIRQGKYDDALQPARHSLELREAAVGPEHRLIADSLHLLAEYYDNKGNYTEAEPVNLRALAIREHTLGPDHQDVARSLFNLAWIYQTRQDYAKAEAAYQRALAIQQRIFGEWHREVATTLNDLAILYHKRGDYEKAVEIDLKVLGVRERILGDSDVGVALTLNNLGLDYILLGDYVRAEPCFLRALRIYEDKRGPDHPDVATASNNLGMVYENKGDYAAAERLHLRALAIDEAARGPSHPSIGAYLNNLAILYQHQQQYDKAAPLWIRALAIREKALGPTHSDVGEALNNLANFYVVSGTGQDDEIESLLQRSRSIIERAQGPDDVRVAAPATTLAALYDRRGQLERAEPLYQRALAIREQALGPDHPTTVAVVGRLANLYRAKGDTARALGHWTRYSEAQERNIAHNLPIGSDRQKLAYLSVFTKDVDDILSFHARSAPGDDAALRLALTTILRRKGRGLDAAADTVNLVRAHAAPADHALFDSLSEWRGRLASLALRSPERDDAGGYRARLERTAATVEAIEADISLRSGAFRSDTRPVTLEAVQEAIPNEAALIEYARYRPAEPGAERSTPRYSAYVLTASRVEWVDLGDASTIDRLVDEWRGALRDPRRADVRELARAVDERIMRPVRAHLGAARQLLVSPDGVLHLIPYAALVDEHDRYLVDRYPISYLTSGRDLLRLRVPRTSRSGEVIVADPAFGEPALAAGDRGAATTVRVDHSQMFFGPLPGVSGELGALRGLLPRARFLTKERATKAALAQVSGPRILHIATHGFFLEQNDGSSDATSTAVPDRTRLAKVPAARIENPLLRSGLALAGANSAKSVDGVLTALEAANLDLWGTQLVVLSACDTGVGEVRSGDGVYGLRRALVLAGSESQMISLWPVSDSGTRDLVIGYYTRLLRGGDRGDSLREVQQAMLHRSPRAHPYYWASFILSGQWTKLDARP